MFKCPCPVTTKLVNKVLSFKSCYQAGALLAVRLWLAKVFLASGMTKIANWNTTILLFEDEYQVPLLSAELAAYLATAGEFILPALLILGLATPLAALGLVAMTLVIELFVYPGTTEHYYWLLLCFVLVAHGGGRMSLDYWLMRKFCGVSACGSSCGPDCRCTKCCGPKDCGTKQSCDTADTKEGKS